MNMKNKLDELLEFKGNEFYNNMLCKLETFCSLVNEDKDFDPDCCDEGYLEFIIPLNWLVDCLNEESASGRENTLVIENLDDLNNWHKESTYYDTEFIFRKAEEDKILMCKPVVHNCNYCKKSFK